jgi:hypothetical protein
LVLFSQFPCSLAAAKHHDKESSMTDNTPPTAHDTHESATAHDYRKIMEEIGFQTKRRATNIQSVNSYNRAALLPILAQAGIATVTLRYDGEGDSGGIEEIYAQGLQDGTQYQQTLPLPSVDVTFVTLTYDGDIWTETRSLIDALEAWGMDLIDIEYSGWENNDGGYGEVSINVDTGSIMVSHNQRYMDVTSSQTHY